MTTPICRKVTAAPLLLTLTLSVLGSKSAHAQSDPSSTSNLDVNYVYGLVHPASGSSLFVGQAVTDGHDSSVTNFAAGCQRWLHLYADGQFGLDRTVSWNYADDARVGLKQEDFTITPSTAPAWSAALGKVNIAVGTLTASGDSTQSLSLSYQVYAPDGTAIGSPVSADGTLDTIASMLPTLASGLDGNVGISDPALPSVTGLTASELECLGAAPWRHHSWDADPDPNLVALGKTNALANLILLEDGYSEFSGPGWTDAANALMKGAPNNPVAISALASTDNRNYLALYVPALPQLDTKYPQNFLVAKTNFLVDQAANKAPAEVADAEHSVACAPESAESWNDLSNALLDQGESVRHGAAWDDLELDQQATLLPIYAKSESVALKATAVNPNDATAWLTLSKSAGYNADSTWADKAVWSALQIDPENQKVYEWGSELFQPKWENEPDQLVKLAQTAADHSDHVTVDCDRLQDALLASGRIDAFPGILKTIELKDPTNASAWEKSGQLALAGTKPDFAAAKVDYTTASTLDPDNADNYGWLATIVLEGDNQPADAEVLFRKAMKLSRRIVWYHDGLVECFKREKKVHAMMKEVDAAKKGGLILLPVTVTWIPPFWQPVYQPAVKFYRINFVEFSRRRAEYLHDVKSGKDRHVILVSQVVAEPVVHRRKRRRGAVAVVSVKTSGPVRPKIAKTPREAKAPRPPKAAPAARGPRRVVAVVIVRAPRRHQ